MSAKTVAELAEMGFTPEQCTKAVQNVGDNLEAACNWIVTHGQNLGVEGSASKEHPMETTGATPSDSTTQSEAKTEDATANSFKCGNCGKLSATMQLAIVHAERTGHDQIEESTDTVTPLTEEEKMAKKASLHLRIAEKKVERAKLEQQEAIDAEKRRRVDQASLGVAQREAEEREMKEIVEDRKRQKAAELTAKNRVLSQIQADKDKRKREKEILAGEAAPPPPKPKVTTSAPVIDHNRARIQIRQLQTMGKSAPLVHEFSGEESLSAVRLYIQMNRSDGFTKEDAFYLKIAYPPKTFSEADMDAPLKSLGLTPSGTLIMEPMLGRGAGGAGVVTLD